MKTLPRKALEQNTETRTRTKMKSTGMLSAIHQSNASNLRKTAQVAWTLRTNLSMLRKRRATGDGETNEDTKGPVPVGDMVSLIPVGNSESPVPMGDTRNLVTGDVGEDRITKFTDEGEERSIAGDPKETGEKSDLYF